MKKFYIAMILGITLGNATPALAASGGDLPDCAPSNCTTTYETIEDVGDCYRTTAQCYYGTNVVSCASCNPGTTKRTLYAYPSQCRGNVAYTKCCPTSCSNCESTSWTSVGGGVEQRVNATCDCGSCNKTTEYQCASGYYGSGRSCSPCPSGGSSSAGTTSASGCYISDFSDSTGSGYYSGGCYWK